MTTATEPIPDRRELAQRLLGHNGEMFLGGRWTASSSGDLIDTIDPTTEELLGAVPKASAQDVDRAVAAGYEAQPGWARLSWNERAAVLFELASRVERHAGDFALLDALDGGISVTGMKRDVSNAVGYLRYFGGLSSEVKGDSLPMPGENIDFTLQEPYGVVGRIVPFNHPIQFAAQAIAAPLAAGNAVILKPADQTPLSALYLAKMAEDLLPAGVLSVLTGDGITTGSAIVRHHAIPRIGFTGSVPTGRQILRDAAEHIKAVTLELGGKNPLAIFPDADPVAAAAACARAMNFTRGQGQSCGSPSRVFVHEDIHDQFRAALLAELEAIRVGDPVDALTEMGPLAFKAHYERVVGYVGIGTDEDGATLIAGGRRPAHLPRGYFLEPTVFDAVSPGMRIAREEVFGPVLALIPWHDADAMVDAVNELPLGLTANVWTSDLTSAMRFVQRVRAGYLSVNGAGQRPIGTPFGGYGLSGLGKDSDLSELLSYARVKNVNVNLTASALWGTGH
ncbi:MAG: aldehyde dehydrogenase family protein [Trebonia sp.]